MHDLLQQMGWEIVRQEYPREPGKWSRLWELDKVYDVLRREMVRANIYEFQRYIFV